MNRKEVVTVLLIIFAATVLLTHISLTTLDFSRYNRDWSGTSWLFAELDAHGARDMVTYDDLARSNDTLLLIIIPDGSFSDSETAALRQFLENGNTLFIADETGNSNRLLEEIGRSIRVQPEKISSVEMQYWGFWSVIAYVRKPDPLLANVSSLTLNRPSAVRGGETLASTTFLSWEDTNRDYKIDANETLSSFTILAREPVGNGTLYVLSDPSIFINGMRNVRLSSGNGVFIQNLLTLHPNILVEQTHSQTSSVDAVLGAVVRVKNTMIIKVSILTMSILFVGVAFWRRMI